MPVFWCSFQEIFARRREEVLFPDVIQIHIGRCRTTNKCDESGDRLGDTAEVSHDSAQDLGTWHT